MARPLARRTNGILRLNQREFEQALRREAEKGLPQVAKEFQSLISYSLFTGIVEKTPVLTGRARVNWQVTYAAPSIRVIDGEQKINTPGNWFSSTGQTITGNEQAKILPAVARIMALPLGQTVYITNNLSYIGWLEDGTSAKAPGGMVEVSINTVLEGVQVQFANMRSLSLPV